MNAETEAITKTKRRVDFMYNIYDIINQLKCTNTVDQILLTYYISEN